MYEYGSKVIGSGVESRWSSYKSPYLLAELDQYEYRSPYKRIWAQQGRQVALHQATRLNGDAGITGSATARAGWPEQTNGIGAKVTPPASSVQPQAPATSSTLNTAMLVGLGIGAIALVVALLRRPKQNPSSTIQYTRFKRRPGQRQYHMRGTRAQLTGPRALGLGRPDRTYTGFPTLPLALDFHPPGKVLTSELVQAANGTWTVRVWLQ